MCPNAAEWPNVLLLCVCWLSAYLFKLQDWNRYFLLESTYVKNIKRNSLHIPILDYLIEIFVEGPPLGSFSADLDQPLA